MSRCGSAACLPACGIPAALRLAALCHLGMVALLLALPLVYDGFHWIYLAGVAAIGGLLAYEHCLVRPDDLSRVNRALLPRQRRGEHRAFGGGSNRFAVLSRQLSVFNSYDACTPRLTVDD